MQICTLFSYSNCKYISCINWALLACLLVWLIVSTDKQEGLGQWTQIVVVCGWDYCLYFSLISFLLTFELCSNPTLAQVQPPLLSGPEAWNRLASMRMSDSVMVQHGLLDRRWLTRSERLMQWVTQPFKWLWCELTVMALNSVKFRL